MSKVAKELGDPSHKEETAGDLRSPLHLRWKVHTPYFIDTTIREAAHFKCPIAYVCHCDQKRRVEHLRYVTNGTISESRGESQD